MSSRSSNLDDEEAAIPQETSPLLNKNAAWKTPPGFIWIEVAIFSNVFLYGFDGAITASTYAVIGSEFNAANNISWLTTSYLITSTAFQPLYGLFLGGDILDRRLCFLTATITFLLGCLGCGMTPDIISLNIMRALTGLGGGGLMTMATIINSDIIPFKERGMYQAVQNVLHRFESICGASLGGLIADTIGWRRCFLFQVPVSLLALVVGYYVVKDLKPQQIIIGDQAVQVKSQSLWKQIDLSGAVLLVLGLSAQLAALSMGGNDYPWSDWRVIVALVVSVILLAVFVLVEATTKAILVMPISMFKGCLAISNLLSNVCVGMAAYSVSSMIDCLILC
jgi:MFS family permease